MDVILRYLFIFIMMFLVVVELGGVTVNPSLCPTNKIAPHRRVIAGKETNHIRPRTFGLINELFRPNRHQRPLYADPLDDLQEQPQEDDPDDCGEIDDYDETDLSSVTPGSQRRRTNRENRFFPGFNPFGPPIYNPNRPVHPQESHHPARPPPPPIPNRPLASNRPSRPNTRPSYGSGGIFSSNGYRPGPDLYPSSEVKPVKENTYDDPQAAYRPTLVGGHIGHIVGFAPVKPTVSEVMDSQRYPGVVRFPESDSNRRPRAKPSDRRSASIIGSFVDLLFY